MTAYYKGIHRDQFDGSYYQSSNCVPTAGANGARVVTGGAKNYSGGQVRLLIPRNQEQNPGNPGWSLGDLDNAMAKIGVGFNVYARSSWAAILDWSDAGYAVAMQGLSRVFTEGCSAKFDGGHCILLHPATYQGLRLIGDGICTSWRYERPAKLQQYVEALYGKSHIRFGLFTKPVPIMAPDTGTEDSDVVITVIKGEDWKAIGGNGVFRAAPDRGLVPNEKVVDGTIVRTIAEATTSDGNNWRMTERNGKPAWMIRSDWQPVTPGGDPLVDGELTKYIKRQ